MNYKVIIKKCDNPFRSVSIVDEIVLWSGAEKETIYDAIISRDVCLRKNTNQKEAEELRNRFEGVGATVELIELEDESNSFPETQEMKKENKPENINPFVRSDSLNHQKHEEEVKVDNSPREPSPTETDHVDKDKKRYSVSIDEQETKDLDNKNKKKKVKAKEKKYPSDSGHTDLGDMLITSDFKEDYIKELFRSLRTKILMRFHDIVDKSMVVTSLEAGVGKSTIASNMAITIAQQNWKTVLIDGDLRRGMLYKFFNKDQTPGLSDYINSDQPFSPDTMFNLVQKTHVKDLFLITNGNYVLNSSDLLTSKKFIHLKKQLSQHFDMVILDTPPLGSVADPVVVNEFFSRYILIVKAGKTNVIDLKKKIKEFPVLQKKILGLILNFAEMDTLRSYYKYSKYY